LKSIPSRYMDRQQFFQQRLEQLQVDRIRAVGPCVGRVIVNFQKQAVYAGGYSRTGQQGNELRLTAAYPIGHRRLLHRMGGVKNHWRDAAHDGQGAVIDHQRVVAEAGSALGKEDALIARRTDFLDRVGHIPWGNELAFLDVDGATGFAGGYQQIRLAAEKGGNLEHVHGFGGHGAVGRLVHIGQHRQAGVLGQAAQDARALDQARPAKTLHAGAVGLVVAGLEDVWDAEVCRDALNRLGHPARMSLRLDDTWAGDQE